MRRLPLSRTSFWFYRLILFSVGGMLYGGLELLWRGKTHPTMLLLGGFCFLCFSELRRLSCPLLLRCLLGALAVTVSEYLCGLLVNCAFGWKVWDYSKEAYSLHGQICLRYSLYWLALSLPSFALTALTDRFCLWILHRAPKRSQPSLPEGEI